MDGWNYHTPCVTTPVGSEGLFLESWDQDWEMKRLKENDEIRFYKPEREILREVNPLLDNYYEY